uniref:Phorbol-ester/DAG-type domain-containing protein n=1 Tax=Leersia perrieri TaxID=77586 RepID=A0A0D9X1F5_9ORYZ
MDQMEEEEAASLAQDKSSKEPAQMPAAYVEQQRRAEVDRLGCRRSPIIPSNFGKRLGSPDQQRKHFAHPADHQLTKSKFSTESFRSCDICRAKLSGHVGYRCKDCDLDIHEACVDHFKKTISHFVHPWHTLTLSPIPNDDGNKNIKRPCHLCVEPCIPGSFVYSCVQCGFDVHPLCTRLPQTVRSPLHPRHDLNLVPGIMVGRCSACREDLQPLFSLFSLSLRFSSFLKWHASKIAASSGGDTVCEDGV